MTRFERVLRSIWVCRWMRSAIALVGGVRVHPTAQLLGRRGQLRFGRGTALGARTRTLLGARGRLTTGDGVWIASDVQLETDTELQLGSGTTLQRRCTVLGTVCIGRGCIFAPNVFVSSGTHPFRLQPHLPIREQERRLLKQDGGFSSLDRPVCVEDDCWLGTNVVIGPGVTVGKGAVVGANSVVLDDVEPYTVVAGAPAHRIGERLQWQPPWELRCDDERQLPYVLCGVPVLAADGCTIAVAATNDEPAGFIMAAGGQSVRFLYEASADLTVEAAGERHLLRAGRGVLEVDAKPLPHRHSGLSVTVTPVSAPRHAHLSIFTVTCVGT
jgi:acetyltransferase-like isoleucine patch superfamily enzyme